jgi:hypothetical protein
MCPWACGRVSTCTWLCIHVQMALYPHAHCHRSTCSFINRHVADFLSAQLGYVIQFSCKIRLCAMGHSAEVGSALWAIVQNIVKPYWPHFRIIGPGPELHELQLKAGHILHRNYEAKNCSLMNCTPRMTFLLGWKKWLCAVDCYTEWNPILIIFVNRKRI